MTGLLVLVAAITVLFYGALILSVATLAAVGVLVAVKRRRVLGRRP